MTASGHLVYIVGAHTFQNNLIMSQLQNQTLLCYVCSELNEVPLASTGNNNPDLRQILILFDCWGLDHQRLLDLIDLDLNRHIETNYLVMFNINSEFGIEKHALQRGVKGFIYSHDDAEILRKAIPAVFNGEVWFPRRKLTEHLLAEKHEAPGNGLPLTKRQKDILRLVIEGKYNAEIAYDLCVSLHTVKTHIYNVYKKINATNRAMAIRWAMRNL